jgi:cell division FtsZ-interacting protein ZapD
VICRSFFRGNCSYQPAFTMPNQLSLAHVISRMEAALDTISQEVLDYHLKRVNDTDAQRIEALLTQLNRTLQVRFAAQIESLYQQSKEEEMLRLIRHCFTE